MDIPSSMSPSMKKVGIITIVKVNNYGAELQALATQKAVENLGYYAEIIDYPFYKNARHKSTKRSKPLFSMPLKKRVAEWLYPRIYKWQQKLRKNEIAERRAARFAEFHKANTIFSREYRTAESLQCADMDYDVYIVGSDQVWNPNNYTSLDPYFLKFAPKDKIRMSYASSIGVSQLPERTKHYYSEALRGLDAVSVREENAVKLVKDISGVEAQWVLDPTLLLPGTEWLKIGKKVENVPRRYVLLYEITPSLYLKRLALKVAGDLKIRVVRICREAVRQESDDEIVNIMDAGPAEFIWLLGNAEMVLTNSFHGTAFSINMQRNFYTVAPARKQNNSRQKSLLKLVGLEDRLIIEEAPMPGIEGYDINFEKVNTLLEVARNRSMNYLRFAIDGKE